MRITVRSNLPHFRSLLPDKKGKPMSIRQLAEDIDHNFEAVRKFDSNESTRYSQDLLVKLCEYFTSKGIHCTVGDLIVTEIVEEDGEESHS